MIINFSLENWMSFKNRATFTMVKGRELNHRERIPVSKKNEIGILPIAAIYGGNASGKTNLFKALYFAKRLIVRGTRPGSVIPVEPFRLDDTMMAKSSSFSFDLLINEVIYSYSFSVTSREIVSESLFKVVGSKEECLFDRTGEKIHISPSIQKVDNSLSVIAGGTQDNQLFLTNSFFQKKDIFSPVYKWFKESLVLVAPDSRFGDFKTLVDEKSPYCGTMKASLPSLDTGVVSLGSEDIPFESLGLPESLKTKILEEYDDKTFAVEIDTRSGCVQIVKLGDKLIAKKLVSYHANSKGENVKFEISQESDGTQRLIDLLPAFLDLSMKGSSKVYVIDEVDRSLHTLITRELIQSYLSICSPDTRAQLLFTTHDVLLMDQSVTRRDEMWITERNYAGESSIMSISEYKDVRMDKDIRKSYLQGRFGGVPKALIAKVLAGFDREE